MGYFKLDKSILRNTQRAISLELLDANKQGAYISAILPCQIVGFRRFAVGAQQHFHIVQLFHLLVVDGDEAQLRQALALHAVVHNVAQAVELVALGQFLFGLADGSGHAETETTAAVNLYRHTFSGGR